jgi:malonyl CoA-acyl carrier protein transacylase
MAVKDESTAAFRAMSQTAETATRAVEKLKQGIGLLGVGLGFREAKRGLIDFNAELEDSRVVMSGMLTMFTGAELSKAWDRAGESVDTFNKMAAKSSLTTKDLVGMASMIERPLLQAGVRMADIEKITFGAANAAKAFGIGAEVAAMDIQQALGAGVHIKDRFAMSLLAQKGIDLTPEKFNALSMTKRVEALQRAAESNAITQMAKKQGEDTFHGVVSTLEDNMSLLVGRIGQPMFRVVTAELSNWNTWMEKNDVAIKRFGETLSRDIVTGFRYIKTVGEFLYDHAETFIEIGKIWTVAKLAGGLGGGLGMGSNMGAIAGAFSGAGGGIASAVRAGVLSAAMRFPSLIGPMTGVGNIVGKISSVLGGLGGAAGALGPAGVIGIGYAAHELGEYLGVHRALTQAIDPTRSKLVSLTESMEVLDDAVLRTAHAMGGEKGALGTTNATNALGVVDLMKRQMNVISDIQSGRITSSVLQPSRRINALKEVGYTDDEARKLLSSPQERLLAVSRLAARSQTVGSQTYLASHQTDIGVEAAMKLMSDSERASIDTKKATQMVMEKFMQLFSSSGYGMTGLNAALMSPVEIKKMMLTLAQDPFKGANINQNITNNIKVEMSAKDPDRWLQELDEKVARKIRAPSQPRGSIIVRGGL